MTSASRPRTRRSTRSSASTSAAAQLRAAQRAVKASQLQDTFFAYWRMLAPHMPAPVPEYKFDSVRKWRIDFAWIEYKVAVEMDGGGFGQPVICTSCGATVRARNADGSAGKVLRIPHPSHYTEAGHTRDNEKSNALVAAGWQVLRFTSRQLEEAPLQCIQLVQRLIQDRMD